MNTTLAFTKIDTSPLPQPAANPGEITVIIGIILGILGAIAILMITIAGLRYITSGGDPQKAARARNAIFYTLIGLVVIVLAETIVAFIAGYFT